MSREKIVQAAAVTDTVCDAVEAAKGALGFPVMVNGHGVLRDAGLVRAGLRDARAYIERALTALAEFREPSNADYEPFD